MGNRTVAPRTSRAVVIPDTSYTTYVPNSNVPTAPTHDNSIIETYPNHFSIPVTSPTLAAPVTSPKPEAPVISVTTTIPVDPQPTIVPENSQTPNVWTAPPDDNQPVSSTSEKDDQVLPEPQRDDVKDNPIQPSWRSKASQSITRSHQLIHRITLAHEST